MNLHSYQGVSFFVISALLVSLSMSYPQTLWFFVFFFLVPILYYLENFKSFKVYLFGKMFLFGFIFAALSTLWFLSTYPLDWMGVESSMLSIFIIGSIWLLFCLVFSIPIALWPVLLSYVKTKNIFVGALLGASLWILLEYLRSWFVAFGVYGNETLFGPHHTYYSLGYVAGGVPVLKDVLAVGGLYLASFLIIISNYFFYSLYRVVKNKEQSRMASLYLLGVIVFIILGSFLNMKYVRGTGTAPSFVASVVTTYLPATKDKSVGVKKAEVALKILSEIDNKEGVIILPENLNVVTPFFDNQKIKNELIASKHLIIGSYTGLDDHSMFFLTPLHNNVTHYKKQLLMPVGEYGVTAVRFLIQASLRKDWLDTYDRVMTATQKSEVQKQYVPGVFKDSVIKGLVIGGSICSENISPHIYTNATKKGATVLVNIASHAPFHGSQLLMRQTRAINTVRALENGRYFVTASNYGESFVVSDKGLVKYVSNDTKESSFFNAGIEMQTYVTPYVRYGDYTLWMALGILLLGLIWLFDTRNVR